MRLDNHGNKWGKQAFLTAYARTEKAAKFRFEKIDNNTVSIRGYEGNYLSGCVTLLSSRVL